MNFYFYDLETSGFNPRSARIMQFAGQRTDKNLKPIGQPDNVLIKITSDILPDPYAILVTGITPQKTLSDGISEADFTRYFNTNIVKPNTVFVGFNSIRFDDEFMRHLFYRNFYDPYGWHWQDGCSRWDLLDVSRMMRALRPAGIKWPFSPSGAPSNQLAKLTQANKLDHTNAHDALSDVQATIALAALIKSKQPKLFEYLLNLREKQKIAALVGSGEPFIYTSGKYPGEYEKTTIAAKLTDHPRRAGAIVYDLRHDPLLYAKLKPAELAAAWARRDPTEGPILPVKTLQYNRAPAVAPLSVLDKDSQKRLKLDMKTITKNAKNLQKISDWPNKLLEALEILDRRQQQRLLGEEQTVDNQLYDGFFDSYDKQAMKQIRESAPEDLAKYLPKIKDKRLRTLLPLYKARNFPDTLSTEEQKMWEKYRHERLIGKTEDNRLGGYFKQIEEIKKQPGLSKQQDFILGELELYGQSILPAA